MLTFGIQIILIVLVIAGVAALVGDYIGRSIGRKRLSFLKLRPRYTAIIFTVLTGVLIALGTIIILLAVSQDVRTALFGLEDLKKELADKSLKLTETKKELLIKTTESREIDAQRERSELELAAFQKKLNASKREISTLEETKSRLKREIQAARKGTVLFGVDEVILTSTIMAGPEKEKLETGLKQILSAADAYVRSFGIPTDKHLIFMNPEDFSAAVSTLSQRGGENIVSVIAISNTVLGEEVPVRFSLAENKLVYPEGSVIAQTTIPASLSIPEIEQRIKGLLLLAHQDAKEEGIVGDASGSIGSIPYSQIYALAKKIKAYNKGVTLQSIAKTDTSRMGPLQIEFKILYK
ncbi:MAG: DUF3084 domain-containing protein [Candidatus Saganbacteria bacterium]|nr:DUF3084 domain-containing protein [Candidatus Saganbacteria bacterium]